MDPRIVKFLKVDKLVLETKYREVLNFNDIDLSDNSVSSNILSALVPYRIDQKLD